MRPTARLFSVSLFILMAGTTDSALAQEKGLAFDVATVRISQTTIADIMAGKPIGVQVQGTRVTFGRVPAKTLIAQAYGVQSALVAMPEDRTDQPLFDIVATMPEGSTREQYPEMLKVLLAERFGLKTHREQRDVVATVLVVSKGGSKLTRVPVGTPVVRKADIKGAVSRIEITDDWEAIRNSMVGLNAPNEPFFDQTGFRGMFSAVIEMVRTPELWSAPNEHGGYAELIRLMAIESAERLGFKVEHRKLPLDVIVVDHVNTLPTEN
jgi:uncharacterized protein (TIGR03435 family)